MNIEAGNKGKTINLPVIIDFSFNGSQCRTLLNTKNNVVYVCLSDLLSAMGSTSGPRHVLPEIEETFGDGGKIVTPIDNDSPINEQIEETFGDGGVIVTPIDNDSPINEHIITLSIPDAMGRTQETTFISEHAAIFVVSRGRTELSKRLNKWLFTEVIPAIRKSGSYSIDGSRTRPEICFHPDYYIPTESLTDKILEWCLSQTDPFDYRDAMRGTGATGSYAGSCLKMFARKALILKGRDGYYRLTEKALKMIRSREKPQHVQTCIESVVLDMREGLPLRISIPGKTPVEIAEPQRRIKGTILRMLKRSSLN